MIGLRAARSDDAPRLSEIAGAAKAHWGYPPAWLAAWREGLTITPALLAAAWVRVAIDDGQAVGFVVVEQSEDGCEITHLWVAPTAMRRGVGRLLVDAAVRHARTRSAAPVEVEADPNAVPFYERVGFVRTGTIPAPMPGAAERTLVAMRTR